jgi:Holliday junction resolvasome RuvABC ATP-dependent DNA helicase subunit
VGKTTLARLYGETLRIPFIEIQPHAVRDARDLFKAIANKLEDTVINFSDGPASLKMIQTHEDPVWRVPPCVVFIDEVHALPRNLIPELLKAVEPKDGILVVENGTEVDCRKVCWIIATTERGLLFPPFENRFRKIHLDMYGAEEIAAIVQLNHPHWNLPLCQLAVKYCGRVPREALAFAADMQLEWEKSGGGDWTAIAARVAKSCGIDRFGMTKQRLNILVALGQLGPIAKGRMCDFAQCQIEELEKFVMPALIICTAAEPAMVAVTSQGYQITWQGIRELKRRGIPHRGAQVVADGIHRLDFGNYDPDDFGD